MNTLLMAAAFALPPKLVDRSWGLEDRQRMFVGAKVVDNWSVQVIDVEPSLHTLLVIDKRQDELSWVSSSGAKAHHYNLRSRARYEKALKLEDRAWAPYERRSGTRLEVGRGAWELARHTLYFVPKAGDGHPLWSLPIVDDLVSVEVDRDRSTWLGLSTYPNRLYHLFWMPGNRRDEALLEVIKWDDSSELVSWVPCSEGNSVLIENKIVDGDREVLIHQLRENKGMRTLEWAGSAALKGYWATAVAARTCTEVFLATTAGIIRAAK